jgi:hypothetical protein
MSTSLLQIIQDATAELGLAQPSAVTTATDLQTVQMLALANRCGRMLMSEASWSKLNGLYVINIAEPLVTTGNLTEGSAVITNIPSTATLTATDTYYAVSAEGAQQATQIASIDSATQITMNMPANGTYTGATLTISQNVYDQPADWHDSVNRTQWDRTNHWELQGPVSSQQYQWLESGIVATGPRRKYRIQGSTVVIWPPPSSSDTPSTLAMEYMSSYWVLSSTGTPKPRFTADTDTTVFDPDLMVMGIKWLFFQAKGFEYTELRRQWRNQVSVYAATDSGAATLDMAGRVWPMFVSPANIQDGNFPG